MGGTFRPRRAERAPLDGTRALAPLARPGASANQPPAPVTAPTPHILDGRLAEVASRDAAVQYEEYDMLGRPGITRAIRYAKRSGFAATPEVSDVHTQRHLWTIFDGERERWRMPAAGASVPATEPASPWRSWIVENRDAGGNITLLADADGSYRSPATLLWNRRQCLRRELRAQALRGSAQWSVEELERIWSEEALTAVVLPRYHIDHNIKRALGAKLGTLKEKEKLAS